MFVLVLPISWAQHVRLHSIYRGKYGKQHRIAGSHELHELSQNVFPLCFCYKWSYGIGFMLDLGLLAEVD